jgi:hypothetical protein
MMSAAEAGRSSTSWIHSSIFSGLIKVASWLALFFVPMKNITRFLKYFYHSSYSSLYVLPSGRNDRKNDTIHPGGETL